MKVSDDFKFKKGQLVVFIDAEERKADPLRNPPVGTMGVVCDNSCVPHVQWPNGTTSRNDRWAQVPSELRHATFFEKLRYRIFGK